MKTKSILQRIVRFLTPRQFRRPLHAKEDAVHVPPHERRHAAENEMTFRDRQRMGRI